MLGHTPTRVTTVANKNAGLSNYKLTNSIPPSYPYNEAGDLSYCDAQTGKMDRTL